MNRDKLIERIMSAELKIEAKNKYIDNLALKIQALEEEKLRNLKEKEIFKDISDSRYDSMIKLQQQNFKLSNTLIDIVHLEKLVLPAKEMKRLAREALEL
jgi:hypothetical protein